jgi:glycerol uptake facilitator-like aquaporin
MGFPEGSNMEAPGDLEFPLGAFLNSGRRSDESVGQQPRPCLFAGGKALAQRWLFFVAPILGAVIAALVWKLGFDKE